jgi:tRNA G18 (ribose-2'-O)-methylase SpoU
VRKLRIHEIGAQRQTPESLPAAVRLPVIAVLDNIRSLYNVGSMFRTADGALLDALYLSGYTPRPPRKEIDKTALGATHSVPWQYFSDPLCAVASARERGAKVCVLEQTTSSRAYHTVKREEFPICLVVGNELTGVSEGILAAADFAIEIPMFGIKHSLNAAVAFGVAVFELSRIWRSTQPVPGEHH